MEDKLLEKLYTLDGYLQDICRVSSINSKKYIINSIPNDLKDDFNCIIEVLNGKYVFGYKIASYINSTSKINYKEFSTIREVVAMLREPYINNDLSWANIIKHLSYINDYLWFFQPIVDRTLKIGIGSSLLEKPNYAPMLADKFVSVGRLAANEQYFVTEKLDGNRCIAVHDGKKWNFISRNGKQMYVDFDMAGLPTSFIYDGEVLSQEQTYLSISIARFDFSNFMSSAFNKTSGTINTHTLNKNLVYNIFDIMLNVPYYERRSLLDDLQPCGKNVRILPVLYTSGKDFNDGILQDLLHNVTLVGGEGLMLNAGGALYTHKRTKSLLKYKDIKSMDMLVIDRYYGEGKYDYMCGGLVCQAVTPDGKVINCNVGTGLSDAQRLSWVNRDNIVGKIVEVEYFSLSQDENSIGTNYYSLRFPRLKKVRTDKNATSIY